MGASPPSVNASWITRTFLGWCLGFVLAIALVVACDAVGLSGAQSPLAIGMGLGVAILQSPLVAERQVPRRGWLLATAAGLAGPFLVYDALRLVGVPVPYALAAYVAAGGVVVGVLQWRVLRHAVARPGWWLAITPPGWVLAGSMVWINEVVLPRTRGLAGLFLYIAVVLSGGIVLGAACALGWRASTRPTRQPGACA